MLVVASTFVDVYCDYCDGERDCEGYYEHGYGVWYGHGYEACYRVCHEHGCTLKQRVEQSQKQHRFIE